MIQNYTFLLLFTMIIITMLSACNIIIDKICRSSPWALEIDKSFVTFANINLS